MSGGGTSDPDLITRLWRSIGSGSGAANPTSNLVGGASGGADILPGQGTSLAATTPAQAQSALNSVGSSWKMPSSEQLAKSLQGLGGGGKSSGSGSSGGIAPPSVGSGPSSSFNPGHGGGDLNNLLTLLRQFPSYIPNQNQKGGLLG